MRGFVLVLVFDDTAKPFDFLAELIAFLFTFGSLILEKLSRSFQLLVSGLYLEMAMKKEFIR